MAKKILGDDPFSQKADSADKSLPGKDKTPAAAKKTKRAPLRKTEAPKATRSARKAPAAVAGDEGTQLVDAEPIAPPIIEINTHSTALTTAAPSDGHEPAPGSWRWWRFRQQLLARAEDAAWLARADGTDPANLANQDRFGRDPVLAGRAEPIVDFVYRSLMRVSVRGLGHVPETGRAILVARRREARSHGLAGLCLAGLARLGVDIAPGTALDAAIIAHAARTEHVAHREVRPLVRAARLYTPFIGRLLRRLGGVPADVHDLARLLDDDRLALAFVGDPEGDDREGVLDRKTLICLSLVTGAPIVPVVIAGATGLFGAARRTTMAFGTPMFLATEFGADGAEDEALVARLAAELTAALQPPSSI